MAICGLVRATSFEEDANVANDRVLCLASNRTEATGEAEVRYRRAASLTKGRGG